jgi:Alpha galactosidase C-terminal beta sandwich domain
VNARALALVVLLSACPPTPVTPPAPPFVGVLNWSSQPQTFTLTAASLGLQGRESVEELWLGRDVVFADGAWTVTVPARDAAYLRFR